MEDKDITVDNSETTAKKWEGWHIVGFNPTELGVVPHEDTETGGGFTKQDFEKAL